MGESLYYTTDHPRPLAVCGFKGGRRVGGLIVTGRNHVLTRKLVRVAITAGSSYAGGGFHRIRPRVFIGNSGTAVTSIEQHSSSSPVQNSSPYVLNYNLSGNIKRAGGGNGTGGVNLTTLPPGGVVIPESFKTDIQDFKGGIKFGLGGKIKHILPSITLHASDLKVGIAGDEEEVVVNQLLSHLLIHASEREVGAGKVALQVGKGLLHQVLHSNP